MCINGHLLTCFHLGIVDAYGKQMDHTGLDEKISMLYRLLNVNDNSIKQG